MKNDYLEMEDFSTREDRLGKKTSLYDRVEDILIVVIVILFIGFIIFNI